MSASLVRKELSQHSFSIAALLGLLGFAVLLIYVFHIKAGASGNPYDAMQMSLYYCIPIGCLILSNLLVIQEYKSQTQLFLEILPVSRKQMVWTKFWLGLGPLIIFTVLLLGISYVLHLTYGTAIAPLAGIVLLRALAFTFCMYAVFFCSGFLGRYRLVLMLFILAGALLLDSATALELGRFGPFKCLDSTFGTEYRDPPWVAMGVSIGLGLLFVIGAFVLGWIKEGDLAGKFGQRMSHREKIFIAGIIILMLSAGELLDARSEKEPYTMHDAQVVRDNGFVVHVAPADAEGGKTFGLKIARELGLARNLLGLADQPPVYVSLRRDLDFNEYQPGFLTGQEGMLTRCNYLHPDFSEYDFLVHMMSTYLNRSTDDRSLLESRKWVADGYPHFQLQRSGQEDDAYTWQDQHEYMLLRALYARPQGPSLEDLAAWHTLTESAHHAPANALAWIGLETLSDLAKASEQSPASVINFIYEMIGVNEPNDFRSLFQRKDTRLASTLKAELDLDQADFLLEWQMRMKQLELVHGEKLATIPRLTADYTVEELDGVSRRIRIRASAAPALADDSLVTLYYCMLDPLQVWAGEYDLERFLVKASELDAIELPDSYYAGDRVYLGLCFWDPTLKCELTAGWKVVDIP